MKECDATKAMAMGRCINELNNKCETKKSFAQQHTLEKGLRKFGHEGEKATIKEMRQLHDRKCFAPTLISELNNNERKKAQCAPLHLTEKRDKSIKG